MDAVAVGDGEGSALTRELRSALDELDVGPSRASYDRACRAADAFVDENLGVRGARRLTAEFAEHGPGLLTRFSDWALLVVVAYHEAGHAVAGWALGQQPTSATIVPTKRGDQTILGSVMGPPVVLCFGRDDPEESSRIAAIVALAGEVAEAPLTSKAAPGARARQWFSEVEFAPNRGRDTDCERYTWLALQRGEGAQNVGPWLSFWRHETAALLAQHAAEVERVALALLQHRTLDETALADILGPMPGGDA